MNRLEDIANWGWEHRQWIPAILVCILFPLGAGAVLFGTYDADLWYRNKRQSIFDRLQAEVKSLELPPRSAINKSEGNHKSSSILVSVRYRSELERAEFFSAMNHSLVTRGWKPVAGENDRISIKTYHYCRGKESAELHLEQPSFFTERGENYWRLIVTVGLSGRITGDAPRECRVSDESYKHLWELP